MSNVTIRITRVTDGAELARQIEPKMANLGQAVGSRAQRLVPKRSYSLHDTISSETTVTGSKVVTRVGAGGGDVNYAMHVERGTSRMSAQPYLRPAFAQTTGRDLKYSGRGITRHGTVTFTAARARRRTRAQRGRKA